MNAYDVKMWERAKEIAELCYVKYELTNVISLKDSDGLFLGCFETVAEVFAFLCGYEHSRNVEM